MPKNKKGRLRKDYLRVGVDELCPAAGLPPVGAVDEVCFHTRNLIMMSNLTITLSSFQLELCPAAQQRNRIPADIE
jgi:hypothetical protein